VLSDVFADVRLGGVTRTTLALLSPQADYLSLLQREFSLLGFCVEVEVQAMLVRRVEMENAVETHKYIS
jgi:hypothetical protein